MDLEFYQLTSAGDREINQDCMAHIIKDAYALFIVADGLGGHPVGEKASHFFYKGMLRFAEIYSNLMARNPISTMSAWIDDAVDEMRQLFGQDKSVEQAYMTCAIL